MRIDGIAAVAFPFLEIIRQRDADALSFEVIDGVDAAGVVEHHEPFAQRLVRVIVDGALVLGELFPPLGILIVNAEQWLFLRLPFEGTDG